MLDPITTLRDVGNVVQFVDLGLKVFSKSKALYKSASGKFAEDTELEQLAETLGIFTQYSVDSLSKDGTLSKERLNASSPLERHFSTLLKDCQLVTDTVHKILKPLSMEDAAQDHDALDRSKYEGQTIKLDSTSQPSHDLGLQPDTKRDPNSSPDPASKPDQRPKLRRKWKAFHITLQRMKKSGEIDQTTRRLDSLSQQLATCLFLMFNEKADQQSTILGYLKEKSRSSERWQNLAFDELEALRELTSTTFLCLKGLENSTATLLQDMKNSQKELWLWQQDTKRVQELAEATSRIHEWKELTERQNIRQQFLSCLGYERMRERHAQIAEAHMETFEWIFKPTDDPASTSFTTWLQCQSGIFWISGKPGSGKSTMMKYISDHEKTQAALKIWAGSDVLVKASFYFWSNGSALQKSLEGLVRSLLFRILSQFPDLISICLPSQWSQYVRNNTPTRLHLSWTWAELLQALSLIARQTTVKAKFCFFIDGLDEHNGDHEELIQFLCDLTVSSPCFKICLSSRPWNVFHNAFVARRYPRLYMENLTRADIQLFVKDTLAQNELYQRFLKRGDQCEDFVAEIVLKADGVFLWVFLVVRSLLEGLKNEDRLSTLKRRLRSLPNDLEAYFQHMLDGIEGVYRQQAAESFHIALHAREPLTLLTFSMLDEETPELAITCPIASMTSKELVSRYQIMRTRLNARCRDLLEVKRTEAQGLPFFRSVPLDGAHGMVAADDFFAYRVDFLHRTVRDFLSLKSSQHQLESCLTKSFDMTDSLCLAFLAQIKRFPIQRMSLVKVGPLSDLLDDLLYYARGSERRKETPVAQTEVLDALKQALEQWKERFGVAAEIFDQAPANWRVMEHTKIHKSRNKIERSFLALVVRAGLKKYIEETIDHDLTGSQLCALVRSALLPTMVSSKADVAIDTDILGLLLRQPGSHTPSQEWADILREFIGHTVPVWASLRFDDRINRLQAIKTILDSGRISGPTNQLQGRLLWVDIMLMDAANWTNRSPIFADLVCDVIDSYLLTGDCNDTNEIYKGSTLWGHFVSNLPPRDTTPNQNSFASDSPEVFGSRS